MTEVQVFEGDGRDMSKVLPEGPMGEVRVVLGTWKENLTAWIKMNAGKDPGGGIRLIRVPMESDIAVCLNEHAHAKPKGSAFTMIVDGWACFGCTVTHAARLNGKDDFTVMARKIERA